MSNSNIIYLARLHWIIFIYPCLILGIGVQVSNALYNLPEIGYFIIGGAFLWGGATWLKYQFSSLTIQKKQVILRTGILLRQTIDIPMSKIESIDVRQSIIGSIFRYGTLIITGTGGTQQCITHLSKPLTCRRHIETLVNELH